MQGNVINQFDRLPNHSDPKQFKHSKILIFKYFKTKTDTIP